MPAPAAIAASNPMGTSRLARGIGYRMVDECEDGRSNHPEGSRSYSSSAVEPAKKRKPGGQRGHPGRFADSR